MTVAEQSLAFLISVLGVGQKTIWRCQQYLKEHEVSWMDFWDNFADLAINCSFSEKQINSILSTQKEYTIAQFAEQLTKQQVRVVTEASAEYPPHFAGHEVYAPVLFAKGGIASWDETPIAVVGTRHMTPYGKLVTEKLVTELVLQDCMIVSGGMYGVDFTAHQAALAAGGSTIAILGYGFDHCFPRSFASKFEEMIEQGMTFFSPFALNTEAQPGNFPARNQLVAAASKAVLVTEAGAKSGSHITAGMAADMGLPVGAVPGPITNPYSEGTKVLVQSGAVLVTVASDVLNEIQTLA